MFDYSEIKSVWSSKALATLPGFENDMRYLEFYYHCVGPKLSGRFDTEFWSRTILQMAHAEHAVRSALIALSHLNQHQSGTLQHARRSALDGKQYDRMPFWLNYNKAIRLLVEHMSKPTYSAEQGLVCCLLFACIEFLQADANVAFTHIRSGLNIVHELRQRKLVGSATKSAETGQDSVNARSNMVEQVLVPILTQALASALPYGASLAKDFAFLDSCPQYFTGRSFSSLDDARSSFFDLRNAAFTIARDMAIKLYGSLSFTQADHKRRNDLLKRHRDWLEALKAFESSQTIPAADTLSLSALRLGYCASYSACACIMDKTQMSYDAHLESYHDINRHASFLIHSLEVGTSREQNCALTPSANFTFDTSLIPALFYLAIRCRCPITRRTAIKLLAKDLPREGLWDAEQHRIVAERVVEIEEMEVGANGWPTGVSRLCTSRVGTEVDWNNGFQASFLYTKDIDLAAQKSWSERLVLGESVKRTLAPFAPTQE
ncbi:uncharacterized protein M421DRAFT_2840 [Didymella exigua CBS 183.55]|uniref:C6 zinc finger domain protein n=1 Tax=Didymella exigua CBS 183.55 TaxID=1150837 RepID=A0A6A5RSB4_9PLEO|nr:uncharacterized protein M421DRAFT_2840 [Didymella exigua CBS 183.55]KAF1931341.1 hypothetical protein M421DRAFT_2840 [Didymella exigua CBS 183.55]